MSKHKYFVKFFKKIYLSINSLLNKYLNKLKFINITKKNFNIVGTKRVFLGSLMLVALFFVYILIPHIHNKVEIREQLKNQLLSKFSTNFSFSKDFRYQFLPRPHFIIEDSVILENKKRMSDVKKLKIYVSLSNLFSLNKITIKEVILEDANFHLNNKNKNFFLKLLDNNFTDKNLYIMNSNIFYQNDAKEVLFINRIIKMKYFYDSNDLVNTIISKNNIFNIPYSYQIKDNKVEKKIISKFELLFPRIQIENEYNYSNEIKKGLSNFIYNKNKNIFNYELNNKIFKFNLMHRLIEPNFSYDGSINFNPFFSVIEGNINELDLSPLLNSNSLFSQLLKTQIFNNKNLDLKIHINADKILPYQKFVKLYLNFKIQESLIDIDESIFSWSNYASFRISDSLIYVSKNQLLLDGKILIDIKKQNEIYKFLQSSKKLRPNIEKIELNINYNFDEQTIELSNIKIDGKLNQSVNDSMGKIILKNNKLKNKIYFRKIMKEAIAAYVG